MDPRPATRQFDRRQFARAASSGLALFAIPGWFAACARTETGTNEPAVDVADGRPLLVLHVADDAQRRWQLGFWFGNFLLHGEPAELAPLATCDLACATTKELEDCGLDLQGVDAILKLPGEAPVVALAGKYPDDEPDWMYRPGEGDPNARLAQAMRLNHAWMAAQLAKVLGAGSLAFERGLARERAARRGFDSAEAPSAERARSAPCHALAAAAIDVARRDEWVKELATYAVHRWSDEGPSGSSWATNLGCGDNLERPLSADNYGIDCGMGYIPEIGQRFLHLFSAEELANG
ncbi:MAG: hypothetical protein NTV21_18335 [Planctomycetota bacterium]|nr:hypothetical protein [Planctomycetota bacterium]